MEKDELPIKLRLENMFMLMGTIVTWALLPVFLYNCSKTARHTSFVTPRLMTIFNPLQGYSCATINASALWQYGIPTHLLCIQWEKRDKEVGLVFNFIVPSTQYFYADVLLRQWSTKLNFTVDSPPVKRGNQWSHKYQQKIYTPRGVMAKNKSVDMMIGNFLFGSVVNIVKLPTKKDKKK